MLKGLLFSALGMIFCAACLPFSALEAPAADNPSPMLSILSRFVAADIPALGTAEPGPTERTWPGQRAYLHFRAEGSASIP